MYESYDIAFASPVLGYWKVSRLAIKSVYDPEIEDVVYFGRFLSRNSGMPVFRLEWMNGNETQPMLNIPASCLRFIAEDETLMEYVSSSSFTIDTFIAWLGDNGYQDMSVQVAECVQEQIIVDQSVERILREFNYA